MTRLHAIPMLALCIAAGCVLRTPTLTSSLGARVVPPAPPSSSAPSGPDAPAEDGQVIEAGCTFTGEDIKGEPGSVREVVCPAGCPQPDYLAGTDDYAGGSPVCAAAVHAGMISKRGGEVTVVVGPARPAFRGTRRHGMQSRDWGEHRHSFRFQGVPSVAPDPEAAPAQEIVDAGCTFEGNQLQGEPGSLHRVSCPGGCALEPPLLVWGTDSYSGHSRVCVAALHAGLIGARGGEFTLILEGKKPAFRGSKRNGIESRDWGSYDRSFRLRR